MQMQLAPGETEIYTAPSKLKETKTIVLDGRLVITDRRLLWIENSAMKYKLDVPWENVGNKVQLPKQAWVPGTDCLMKVQVPSDNGNQKSAVLIFTAAGTQVFCFNEFRG